MAAKKSRNLQLTRYSTGGRGRQLKEAEKETRQGKWGERRKSRKPLRPPRKQEHKAQKEKSKSCGYCGKTGTHSPGRNCPTDRKQCLKCGKYNHYASCCRVEAPHQEEVNEGTQPPQILLDLEIPEKGTQISVAPNQTTVTAETLAEPPNAEIPPELEVEPTQGAEHDQPVNQPAVTRPRREKHEPPYLKD